jgi:predicted phosphodiesterase
LKSEKVLVLPDFQLPYIDRKSIKAVLKYASEHYWDRIIQLGDYADWDKISRWNAENARTMEGWRFDKEYEMLNKFTDEFCKAVRNKNKDAPIVILQGNHDYRVEVVMDKTPMYAGKLEMESNLHFKERKIEYWKYWEHRKPYKLGKAYFIHGEYIGNNHAKKTAENFHRNVFYGHTHDRMGYTKTTVGDDSVYCESLGTLSIKELNYMGKKPSNWMQCFAVFYFQPNGNFNHYVTNIHNHSFTSMDGKFYKT